MNLKDILALVGAACTVVSVGCAVYVALRDSRWRKNGVFAQLSTRIDKAQRDAERWHETPHGKVMIGQIDNHTVRLGAIESRLEHTATREDVERVAGSIRTVEALLKDTSAGVDRIEGMLMKKALDA